MTTQIIIGDVRERIRELADESVHCVVTSPPYFGFELNPEYAKIAQERLGLPQIESPPLAPLPVMSLSPPPY